MNLQRVELVPHSALSARLRWTRFLLQSLRRPLGYTECPHLNPDSAAAEHNASKVSSQQCRGYHPTCHMHCKQMRAKKGNEPPKGRTCPSQCSECPSPMDPIPLAVAAAPPGVHRMHSLEPRLPSGRAQRFKNQQSAAQRFSPYLPLHCKQMRAKKRDEPPKGRTCPSQCSKCPSPMDPIPLAVAAAPPGVHRMPSLEPKLPSGRAQRFKSQQSATQRFSSYLPHALQANESQKTR